MLTPKKSLKDKHIEQHVQRKVTEMGIEAKIKKVLKVKK